MDTMNTRVNEGTRLGISALGSLALATLVASCATTEMTSTWTDPAAKGASLSKVAVVCLTKDAGLRRQAEDSAAAQLQQKGAQAIPSYQLTGDTDLKDREGMKTKLKAAGVDGVLVMRMTGVSEQVTAVDGPYGTFDGYYDYAGAAVYAPGYLETDTIVHVVSNLYDLNKNKLIWSGASQTFDPNSAAQFMTDVSKAVAKSLQKDRLII
jgi:hypothetical protein